MKKRILFTILAIIVVSAGYGFYLYHKPHASIAENKPVYQLESRALLGEYQADENTANKKYLGKIVEVQGIVSDQSVDDKGAYNLILQGDDLSGITCQFEKGSDYAKADLKKGQIVRVKGICTGMLMDVVLVDCVIPKEN